jgi:polyferredoxin
MAVLTAWLLKKGSAVRTLTDAGIVVFLLSMMASMFVSAVIYLYTPGAVTILELFILNMMIMAVVLVPFLLALLEGDRVLTSQGKGLINERSLVVASVIILAILSEVFMGWTFAILGGSVSTAGGITDVLGAVVSSSASYWFIFTMASEMALTLFFMRRHFPKSIVWVIAAQTAIMVLSPTAINSQVWAGFSLVGSSIIMIALFIFIFEFLYRNRNLGSGVLNYLLLLIFAYALMMAGQFLWLIFNDVTVFVLSVLVEMAVYFSIVVDMKRLESSPIKGWLGMPRWVFAFLGLVFVAEFFMGGALDVQVNGSAFFTGMMWASIAGPPLQALGAAFFNFVMFFVSITMSPWFMIMMGIEMGSLVVFRIRYTHDLETRLRLLLMIAAYAVYSILLPGFLVPANVLQQIPWLGWSMGIGSSGAIAPALVLALAGSYLVSGSLSMLFGSRQVCSVLCMAALMYQGTTIDVMSAFNRKSILSQKLLTNRISSLYKLIVSAVWVSLLIAAVLSYVASIGVLGASIFGMDPANLLFLFYFNFLWYLVFIMIPFVGTYGCATTGICAWGAFNQLVSRAGLFRLKAKDKSLCANCVSKDCAKVCPLGLSSQPEAFAAKGEFRNMRCIGDGDCVEACPHKNIGFYDIRHWLRARIRHTREANQG